MELAYSLQRRKEMRELSALPVEIYLLIFDCISPAQSEMSTTEYKATFSSLSLVCRLFRGECQPRLFQNLRFRGHPRTTHSDIFWDGLSKRDEVRRALLFRRLQECTFYSWFNSAALERVVYRTKHYASLSDLTLLRCSLSVSTLALLATISGLRNLTLDGCEVQPSTVGVDTLPHVPRWTKISVLSAQNGEIYPWFISSLRHLSDFQRLEHFSTDHINLASPFFREQYAPRLHTFRLGGWGGNTSDLYNILEALPNTTTLLIPSRNWTQLRPPPMRIAPRLRNITAYPHIAAQLVPSRSISYLHLLDCDSLVYSWPETCFQDVQGSTTGLREVSIPSHALASIQAKDLPVVNILTIRPKCGKRIQTIHFSDNFVTLLQTPLLSVEVVKYAMEHTCCYKEASRLLNLRVQLSLLVRKLVIPFPNVLRIQIGQTVEWSRESPASEHWTPRAVSRSLVRELLLRPDVRNVDDVHGCLLSSLWEKDLTSDARARLGYSFQCT